MILLCHTRQHDVGFGEMDESSAGGGDDDFEPRDTSEGFGFDHHPMEDSVCVQ